MVTIETLEVRKKCDPELHLLMDFDGESSDDVISAAQTHGNSIGLVFDDIITKTEQSSHGLVWRLELRPLEGEADLDELVALRDRLDGEFGVLSATMRASREIVDWD